MPLKLQYNDPKKQNKSYSGKKKAHTFKVQAIIHSKIQYILILYMSKGAVHDFELFKRNLHLVSKKSFILADKGYQGIYRYTRIACYRARLKNVVD
ncbi:transposase [Acinetobacter sp. WU_MDCI_Axc73]|nr:transposase [Acinetobacter sp. WU_MDCI_Axc73]